MNDLEPLRTAVEDLVAVTHQLAQEVHKVATHVERETARCPEPTELAVVLSELSELRHRVRKLASAPA